MSKTNQILLVLLLIQAGLFAILNLNTDTGSVSRPQKIFRDFDFNSATKIEIKAPVNQASFHDNEFTLEKNKDTWVLIDAESYPADKGKIEQFLEKANRIKSIQLVTTSPNYHSKLRVSDTQYDRKITVWVNENAKTFYLGSGDGPQRCHLRPSDSNDVYLVEGLLAWDVVDVSSGWIETALVKVNKDDIWGISVAEQNKAPVRIKRAPDGSWAVDGQSTSPNQVKVDAMLTKSANIVIDHPIGRTDKPDYGLNNPSAMIEILTGTSSITGKAPDTYVTHKLVLGAVKNLGSNKSFYARKVGSPWIVTLPEWALNKLTNVGAAELTKQD